MDNENKKPKESKDPKRDPKDIDLRKIEKLERIDI